ncbi:hypothetical protein CFFPNG_00721 [Methylorubrum aminovorans]
MSSMGCPVSVRPACRGQSATDGANPNVDGNRIRVRDGKGGDPIRNSLGSAGFRGSSGAFGACLRTPGGLQLLAGSRGVDEHGPRTGGAPERAVHLDHAGVRPCEAAAGHAAGRAASDDAAEVRGSGLRMDRIGGSLAGREAGPDAGKASPQAEWGPGAQDAGSRSRTFRASNARDRADHESRPRAIRAKTRSALHSAAMCRRTIICKLHAGDGPVRREVLVTPLGNKTKTRLAT